MKKRENIIPIVTIVIAVIIAFLNIFDIWITDNIVTASILLVVSLLVTIIIIDRKNQKENELRIYKKILDNIQKVKDPVFYSLDEIPVLEDYLRNSTELFYVGGHLNGLIMNNTNLFENWLKEGKTLKLILQNPKNEGLKYLEMPCIEYNYESYVNQINLSIERLRALKRIDNADIEVRVTDITPTQSISILDGHKKGTELCMLLHLPKSEGTTAPFVRLKRADNLDWFNLFYDRYYRIMWDKAKKII